MNTKNNKKTLNVMKLFVCLLIVTLTMDLSQQLNGQYSQSRDENIIQPDHDTFPLSKDSRRLQESFSQQKIPKILWLFSQPLPQQNQYHIIFNRLNKLNSIKFAKDQNYTIIELSRENYHQYLTKESHQKIQKVLGLLKDRLRDVNDNSKQFLQLRSKEVRWQFSQQKQNITKRLITYSILAQNGGIFIDNKATLVQSFNDLISQLYSSYDVNIGQRLTSPSFSNKNPKCFGFYNQYFSSMKSFVPSLQRDYEFEKYVVMYPTVEDYFLACENGNLFLKRVTQVYIDLLSDWKQSKWLVNLDDKQILIGRTTLKQFHDHSYYFAQHIVLQQQQSLLPSNNLAIDTLQLYAINTRLGPSKLHSQYLSDDYKSISLLTKFNEQEVQILMGKMRYLFCLKNEVVDMLVGELMRGETEREFVVEGSFVQRLWFRRLKNDMKFQNDFEVLKSFYDAVKEYKVMQNHQQKPSPKQNSLFSPQPTSTAQKKLSLNLTHPQWTSLQKNIWIIWDKGIQKSNFLVQMCYQNLKLSAQNSNFTLNLVDQKNLHQYISKSMLDQINHAIENVAFQLTNQAISDMWRLALVYEHGGIYLDASTFQTQQSFQWILQIPQIPPNLIWNRYGLTPQVFMLFNSYYGCPLDWHIDHQHNDTRKQWHLSYENNFIAAQRGNVLIKEWLDTMMEWIQLPFVQVYEKMKYAEITGHSWTYDRFWFGANRYLTAMDAIKYIMGRREKLLQQNSQKQNDPEFPKTAAQYYKLWSMPGQMLGQQKFRGQMNYQNRDYRLNYQQTGLNNIYRDRYPLHYVQSVIGPALFQVKFFGYELIHLNKFINSFYLQNRLNFEFKTLQKVFHPQSVLATKLLNKHKQKTLQCLEKYAELSEMKIKLKAINKIWSY